MAGVLLAYLVMRARGRYWGELKPWRSLRWWLAGVVALMLLTPVVWEFTRTGLGSFGPLEAFKTVLLPWFAGVGFGIWIYLTIDLLPPTQDAGQNDAATTIGRDLSFVPIAVAILLATLIVSEQQYGWFTRLQKLTLGGSGLEFAPRVVTGQAQAVSGPTVGTSGDIIGEDRVASLVDLMSTLDQVIERDLEYLHELGDETHNDPLNQEKIFVHEVVVPLGNHLSVIHEARGYNNLGLLIDRPLIDAFRSYIQSHRDVTPETQAMRRRFAQEVQDRIANSWKSICDTEARLLELKFVDPENVKAVDPTNEGLVKSCNIAAAKSMNYWLSSQSGIGFNYALPYGTLLTAMLLNAGDELDSAIRDLDEWVADNSPTLGRPGQSWLVFRALNQAVQLLLASGSSATNLYLAFERGENLTEIGEKLLNSKASFNLKPSWRDQRALLEKTEPFDLLWDLGRCPDELTPSFKRAMLGILNASNTVAYVLSQNTEFAEKRNLIREMEWRADYLGKKVNTRCLGDSADKDALAKADRLQATFFDTAAAVQLALAAREKQQPEKRRRLCEAYKYAQKSITLQENTLGTGAFPLQQNSSRPDFLKKWTKYRKELSAFLPWETYKRRLDEVNGQLAYSGLEC
jgi:hypothetical protein